MKYISLLALFALATACTLFDKLPEEKEEYYAPPGTLEVSENFYCDGWELTNLDWAEYNSWLFHVYGANSAEFKAALPDTQVWKLKNSYDSLFIETYHEDPKFYDYPVVGISRAQALAYSKWRTDRVVESKLIAARVIAPNNKPNPQNHFTVEKFFKGIAPGSDLFKLKIPAYRLPRSIEFNEIVAFEKEQKPLRDYEAKKKMTNYPLFEKVYTNSAQSRARKLMHFVDGNVLELYEDDIIGTLNPELDSLKMQSNISSSVNAWTGFRNVCSWVTVDEYIQSLNQ